MMGKFEKLNIKKISAIIFVIIVAAYFFFGLDNSSFVDTDATKTYIHFVDVGQGDCAIVQSPSGNILIDAGPYSSAEKLVEYIDDMGIDSFKYAIFTHPHSDHIGGAATVLSKYDVENVIMPTASSTSTSFEKMLDVIESKDIHIIAGREGKKFEVPNAFVIELVAPQKQNWTDENELNNASIVAKITIGDVSVLFTGDAERDSENQILNNYKNLIDVDILKVGHHGSSTSSSKSFIEAVSPQVAVISAAKDNEYGHPHKETMSTLNKEDVDIYITYEYGSIVFETDGKGYKIITEKN